MAAEGSRIAVIAAFFANLAIAVAKLVAAALTASAAMLAEGYHSLADTGNQGLLLFGMRAARQPPDTRHPFGRGKEAYFWSFMVAVMLFAGGAVLAVRHGIEALREAHQVENLFPNFIVLGIASIVEAVSFSVAYREFSKAKGGLALWRAIRDSKDSSLIVVLLEDTAALAGLFVALVGLGLVEATGNVAFDGVASLVIGLILAAVAILLAIETKAMLIGESAGREERASIRSRLLAMPEVESVGRLLTMQLGPHDVLVNVEVDLQGAEPPEAAIHRMEEEIRAVVPAAREIFVEIHPRQRG